MIEITKITEENITTDGDLNISLLVNEINNRLGNLDKNINSVNTKYVNLRKAFVKLKEDIAEQFEQTNQNITKQIEDIIKEHFDEEK
ncbi:hypothetical protein [uncultured Aquimarina sp.]|uniref:hypothetical protein n=1 Tax=uncultured Aquimarina sp. TaxID=575652 RepID=UPI0026236C71|nr:hypothetical protein [uncultured Aquimarina sp.]